MNTIETIIPENGKVLSQMIENTNQYWYEMDLPKHDIYPQFDRKLVVTGFNSPALKRPEERIYVFISQLLILGDCTVHKSIEMKTWEIFEFNSEEIEDQGGKIICEKITKDEQGNIIEKTNYNLTAPSVKYIKFLIENKSIHLVEILQKFMTIYIDKFQTEINDI